MAAKLVVEDLLTAPMKSNCRTGYHRALSWASSLHLVTLGDPGQAGCVFFLVAAGMVGCPRPQPDLRSRYRDPRPCGAALARMTLNGSNSGIYHNL